MHTLKQPGKQMLCKSFETLEHISFRQCAAITSIPIMGILSAFTQLCSSTVQQAALRSCGENLQWQSMKVSKMEEESHKSFQGTGVLETVLSMHM